MNGFPVACYDEKVANIMKRDPQRSSKLTISNLSKSFPGGVQALKNVTLNMPNGIYGLLGPNGAGKSTLYRILATLQEPDEGSIRFGNINVLGQKNELRKTLGYLPQEFGLYPGINAEDLLDYFAILKGITGRSARKELTELLLRQTNLWHFRRQKLGSYTIAMQKRVALAVALLGKPELIIADEPTAGLDPAERMRFLNLLSELGENRVVILSTQVVEDVSELCSNMAIIHQGRVMLEAEPIRAVDELQGKIWRRMIDKRALGGLMHNYAVISAKLVRERAEVHVYSEGNPGSRFEPVAADLKDVYFSTIAGRYGGAGLQQKQEVKS